MTPNPNDFPASIFTNTSAYGLMEHADELRRWYEAGGDVVYYNSLQKWVRPSDHDCDLFPSITYRAVRPALIKPSVDWSHLLPWVKAVAWGVGDSDPCGYEFPPAPCNCGCGCWLMPEGGRYVELTATPGLVRGTVPWTEAIVQRPEGV
jgi:hypothetical protein